MIVQELYKQFGHILYFDEPHVYIDTNTGEQLTSVTTLIKKYRQPFKRDYWINWCINNPKKTEYFGRTYEDVKEEWRIKSILGTTSGNILHEYLEDIWNNKIFPINYNRNETITSLSEEDYEAFKNKCDILISYADKFKEDHSHIIPIKPELIVGNDTYAGQIDFLGYDTIQEEYIIFDYKGLSLDTPIPTEKGYTLIKNIQVGDKIFDGNGDLTRVTHISDIHYNPCYKITFNTNESIVCDHEHKWEVFGKFKSDRYIQKTLTTDQMFKYFNVNGSKKRLKIENCKELNLPEVNLPIDPYVLGLWLGDGSRHNGTVVCNNNLIWKEIENRGFKTSKNLEKDPTRIEYRTIYKLRTKLRKNNLLKNKHIPNIYLRASHQQRLDLLRGFMDADGYYNKTRDRYVMITTKKWQAKDLAKLVETFGSSATIIKAKTSGFGKENIPCYHVTFSLQKNPFLCRNQNCSNIHKYKTRSNYKYIKNIERVDTVATKCLTVESALHTYLAGHGLIKTHNTDKKIDYKNQYQNFKKPLTHIEDCEFNKYSLQVNLYRKLLEPVITINQMYIIWFNQNNESYVKIRVNKDDKNINLIL